MEKDFQSMGYAMKTKALSDFHEAYGLPGDDDDDNDEDPEGDEDEHGDSRDDEDKIRKRKTA